MRIYKYAFAGELVLPKGAKILSVQMQGDTMCLWAEVDPAASQVTRKFRVFGTGDEVREGAGETFHYLATVQQGPFVWHIYERTI